VETNLNNQVYDSYVGQYELPDNGPTASNQVTGARTRVGIGIRREGIGSSPRPQIHAYFRLTSQRPLVLLNCCRNRITRFFNRLTGMPVTFCRDDRGRAVSLVAHVLGADSSFKKISDQPPQVPEPPKPHTPVKLDPRILDSWVGQYEFATNTVCPAGIKLRIWRERGQLVGQAWGKNILPGAFDIYPESETNSFLKFDRDAAQLTFIKNEKGEITRAIYHSYAVGSSDCEGKKLEN
jgi:hypothetical protein